MDLSEDNGLYIKLREGNEHAFKTLFEKYYSALCHFACQLLKDNVLAEESVQELFVRLWEKRELLNIETSVKHYLFQSVRNQCLNLIQHQKIRKQYAGRMIESANRELDTEQYFMEVDLIKRIEKSIGSLPPKRKEIFILSREQGLKYKEIAEKLNISIKTVEAQMGMALKYLRDDLKEYNDHILTLLLIFKK